jgi:hypothetical protein
MFFVLKKVPMGWKVPYFMQRFLYFFINIRVSKVSMRLMMIIDKKIYICLIRRRFVLSSMLFYLFIDR